MNHAQTFYAVKEHVEQFSEFSGCTITAQMSVNGENIIHMADKENAVFSVVDMGNPNPDRAIKDAIANCMVEMRLARSVYNISDMD